MSRLVRVGLTIPAGVEVEVSDRVVSAAGKKGSLKLDLHSAIAVTKKDNSLFVGLRDDANSGKSQPMLGTTHRLLGNVLTGVSEGFSKKLIINGVGYRAQITGKTLKLNLGFSHPVDYLIPVGIEIECKTPTEVEVKGSDKQLVGQVAANIRNYRKPEPYKGKGVKYEDEYIFRKETKKK